MEEKKILVIGHKNPDTDSICSAIGYADLKRRITGSDRYEARRAGDPNPETSFVLDYFHVPLPPYLEDVRPQVKDIEIRTIPGIDRDMSLKNAWKRMKEENCVTLPVITERGHLSGLITVNDITKLNMDVFDHEMLSRAKTPYRNIIDALEGELVVGDPEGLFEQGKVLIAAANPDLMENYIDPGDLVILGNRYESQLCAIEMEAGCLVVCLGAAVSQTIRKLAAEKGCRIIVTDLDTLTVARVISQSVPVSFGMVSEDLLTFSTEDYVDEIRDTMARVRHRDFPVLRDGHYCGMISRRNLLGMKKKQVILVDHNEKGQAVDGVTSAEILEIIDHHRLGTIETISPVFFRNQPLGCTGTIIRQMYLEHGLTPDPVIAGLLMAAIISDTLLFRSPTCTETDREAACALAEIAGIEMEDFARKMFSAGSSLRGKSPSQILRQDLKEFLVGGKTVVVSQISSMNSEEFPELREQILPCMREFAADRRADMVFFLMTSILEGSSDLLCVGDGTEELVRLAFEGHLEELSGEAVFRLPGVISRKKQVIPALTAALEYIS